MELITQVLVSQSLTDDRPSEDREYNAYEFGTHLMDLLVQIAWQLGLTIAAVNMMLKRICEDEASAVQQLHSGIQPFCTQDTQKTNLFI